MVTKVWDKRMTKMSMVDIFIGPPGCDTAPQVKGKGIL